MTLVCRYLDIPNDCIKSSLIMSLKTQQIAEHGCVPAESFNTNHHFKTPCELITIRWALYRRAIKIFHINIFSCEKQCWLQATGGACIEIIKHLTVLADRCQNPDLYNLTFAHKTKLREIVKRLVEAVKVSYTQLYSVFYWLFAVSNIWEKSDKIVHAM